MILTCPACGTQYVVKDGAIPAGGRQVRCAACRHSWHQEREEAPDAHAAEPSAETQQSAPYPAEQSRPAVEAADVAEAPEPAAAADEPSLEDDRPAGAEEAAADQRLAEGGGEEQPWSPAGSASAPADPVGQGSFANAASVHESASTSYDWDSRGDEPQAGLEDDRAPSADEDFSPFAQREPAEPSGGSPILKLLLLLALLAAAAAAFWFLAPKEWRERLGIASASETPLQLMMTHSDRQPLASGNEILAVSGRVINPTDKSQLVPPIQAELRSSSGTVVHRWTIPPPARILPPRASATFNSAEVNVPAGGEELTISLGGARV